MCWDSSLCCCQGKYQHVRSHFTSQMKRDPFLLLPHASGPVCAAWMAFMNGLSWFSVCGPPWSCGTFVCFGLLYIISVWPPSLCVFVCVCMCACACVCERETGRHSLKAPWCVERTARIWPYQRKNLPFQPVFSFPDGDVWQEQVFVTVCKKTLLTQLWQENVQIPSHFGAFGTRDTSWKTQLLRLLWQDFNREIRFDLRGFISRLQTWQDSSGICSSSRLEVVSDYRTWLETCFYIIWRLTCRLDTRDLTPAFWFVVDDLKLAITLTLNETSDVLL